MSYSIKSQQIYVTELPTQQEDDDGNLLKLAKPETYNIKYDQEGRGNVKEIKININKKYMMVNFNNGSILIFCLRLRTVLQDISPPVDCHIDGHPLNTNIFIDDSCTMLSYMSSNRREINLIAFDWEYHVTKLNKISVLDKLLASKTLQPLVRVKTIEPEPEVEKKITCNIF